MMFPRMTALAEVLWTHRQDYDNYLLRLNKQYKRLDQLKVHYRMPDLDGFTDNNVLVGKTVLKLQKPAPEISIRYTTDGTAPTASSPEYRKHSSYGSRHYQTGVFQPFRQQ
ncbi:chitobiase/beta-hexosaminidase C-terminal domain-containing protein [Chitinophaga pinensis]|uniref:chitobiase/beta-hexosaminidase C-terminal domain-containing protein n=1 Tax=Chitinophaga pinensis TaxID=79329 RepID=UPI003965661B